MKDKYSIVLDNHKKLTDLCGFNDSNLRLIEELLGSHVYTIGNEIYFSSDNTEKQSQFYKIIEKLQEYTERGCTPGHDLIKGIFSSISYQQINGVKEKIKDEIENLEIIIPGSSKRVYPKSYNQISLVKNFSDFDIIFAVGPAGTGKTYLAVARALSELLQKKKRKLILTRPVVEAGESLGFLPGDLAQKINPYLRPLYDAMESLIPFEMIAKLEETRAIEIAPLAYMRGRSLSDCFIILDEAQNTTKEQMKMFLTRISEGSRAIITGDITQIDLPNKKQSGLIHAVNLLGSIKEIGFTFFSSEDVMRNPLIKKIIDAYEKEK
ncbi:MAG TPA: phosphate starvation-inducible protein PhoH [Actinobacteria bacterium]|nr:phosphate starvation-inducible protein PhoH [Actinomycetota bacterium]